MTNLTPLGNEADILRESQKPVQVPVRIVASVPSTQPPAVSENVVLDQASLDDYSDTSFSTEPIARAEDISVSQAPVRVVEQIKPTMPTPKKQTEYRPFSYRLPVKNYILSTLFFIASLIAAVYYSQQVINSSSISVLGVVNPSGIINLDIIASYIAVLMAILLAITLLSPGRIVLYVSVLASLYGTAYWGYSLSALISKVQIATLFEGIGIYIILIYLFMFSVMLTAFIHTVKSSIRT